MNKALFILFILNSFAYSSFISFKIGNAKPNGLLESFSDNGLHTRINFHQDIDILDIEDMYLTYGLQYIYFGENTISNSTWDGFKIKEGERSAMFDVGIKKYWISDDDNFRLYFGSSFGIAFFREYDLYDYPNTYDPCLNDGSLFDIDSALDLFFWILNIANDNDDDDDCEPGWDDNKVYKTTDSIVSPYLSFDVGAQFYINDEETTMLDLGINYNSIFRINKIDYGDYDPNDSSNPSADLNWFARKIDASYQTVFVGLTFNF